MTGFELRIWRRGYNWTQERAAEELGVCLRTYKDGRKDSYISGNRPFSYKHWRFYTQ